MTGCVGNFIVYASNESKSVLARDLDDCRGSLRNSRSVFLIVYASNESKSVPARDLDDCRDNVRNLTERRRGNAFFSFIRSAYREAVIWIFSYGTALAGEGHFIHTYMGDGNPLPSFEGEPKLVAIPDEIDEFTGLLWESLNEENKVSLFVRYINIEDGTCETRIVNKNK